MRLGTKLAIALVASLSALAELPAKAAEHDCLVRHVTDGRHLNERRLPLYAKWARQAGLRQADSRWVSSLLIGSELFTIPFSREMDNEAREFQDAGIPIVCRDLMPIANSGPDPVCDGGCYI